MADADSEKAAKTGPKQKPKKAPAQGLALLPYLVKYFKTAGFSCVVWAVGYFQWSPSWVLLMLFAYMLNYEYKKIRQGQLNYAKEAAENEKEAILARVEELPSWVFFPDTERAEWLNKMIKQMWPYIGDYTKNILKTSVQPSIENSLPKSLKPFKFEKIDLGDVPPRIGGVKVYVENVKRDEIIMDLEIFHSSDCNIIMNVKGVTAGIKDLSLHGHLRVVMKPLCSQMPIIGGLNVFFLNQPDIDFDLTKAANLLDMPLLSNTLRSVLIDQLSYYLVLPNKLPVQLIQNIDTEVFKYPLPQGVLRLHVVAARELKRADFKIVGKGKSDPYCKIYIGAQVFKTKVVKDTINPTWNVYYEAVVDQKQGQVVELECLDEDPGDDDELGSATIDIQNVAKAGNIDTWLPLEGVDTGMVHIRALWLHLSKDPADLEKAQALSDISKQDAISTEDHLASALLMVNLDSAKNLPRSKRSMSEPSPYVKLTLGNQVEKSIPKAKTTDPKWEENFQFLVNDPRNENLSLEIWDSGKEKKLGTVTVPMKNVLGAPNMTINRPFPIANSGQQSKLVLRLCMRVLTSELPADWARDNVAEDMPPVKDEVEGSDVDGAPTEDPAKKEAEAAAAAGSSVDEPIQVTKDDKKVSDKEKPTSKKKEETPEKQVPKVVPVVPVTPKSSDVTPQGGDTPPAEKEEGENSSPDVEPESLVKAAVDTSETQAAFDLDSSDAVSNSSSIAEKPEMEVRKRTTSPSTSSGPELGKVQMTIRYSAQRSRLIVVVHKCVNLMGYDENNLSDPYINLYLLPDKGSSSKRKTQVIKDNLCPIYDETFDWNVSPAEIPTRSIEVIVKNKNSMFSKAKTHMGSVIVDLAHMDLKQPITEWYALEDPDLVKSK